jgi:hypothetical protein
VTSRSGENERIERDRMEERERYRELMGENHERGKKKLASGIVHDIVQ